MEDPEQQVTLAQDMGKSGDRESKSAIKLYEIGPRFTMQLIKIEEGLLDGEVMFHEFIQKTDEEVAELRKRVEKRKKLKEQRKLKMKQNVEAKKQAKEEAKNKSGKSEPMEDDNDDEEQNAEEELDVKTEEDSE